MQANPEFTSLFFGKVNCKSVATPIQWINLVGYAVEIKGETYTASGYVTVVTPVRTALNVPGAMQKPVLTETFAIGGKLIVKFYGLDGNAAKRQFQFVTYKP